MRSKGSLRRLVGRNLRFNRADPPLHYGQPSPLRCALLSPQGLATLQGPQKPARWSAKGEPPPLSPPQRRGTKPIAGLIFSSYLSPYAHSTQHLPSARVRQAVIGSGTPSPASGEGKGADAPAAPYKHRLAHASGSRPLAFRAGVPVRGVLGYPQACFAFGDPDGSHDPLGKGGAAERWRVVYSVGIATRHGAQPVTTRTSKRKSLPDRHTN